MEHGFNIDALIDLLAVRVAKEVCARLPQAGGAAAVKPRLMTIEQGGHYCGRSKKAMEHLVADKELPVVKIGRRIFLDARDLDRWIDSNKELPEHWT